MLSQLVPQKKLSMQFAIENATTMPIVRVPAPNCVAGRASSLYRHAYGNLEYVAAAYAIGRLKASCTANVYEFDLYTWRPQG